MGKLADALAVAKDTERKSKLDEWVDALPADDRTALLEAAIDPAYSNLALRRIMADNGYTAAKETIAVWRRKHGFAG